MITLTNVLTNQRWELPDALNTQPFFLNNPPWPPGDYNVRNGSGGDFTVVYDSVLVPVIVPAGAVWSVSTNENLYSWFPVGVDYAAWTARIRGGQGWFGWAPVAQVGNI